MSTNGRHWLLDIDVGEVFRFAVEAVDVDRRNGEVLRYDEGLVDPGVALDAAAGAGDASVSVSVVCAVDWARLAARGVPLEGRTATLLRHVEGADYEAARVVLRGKVRGVSYGALYEPIAFDIVREIAEFGEIWPPTQAAVDSTTWPISGSGEYTPEASAGTMYPVIIGSPGYNGGNTPFPAFEAFYGQVKPSAGVSISYIVVGDGTLASSTCRLYTREEVLDSPILTREATRTISQVTDLLGRTVSVITPDSSGTSTLEDVRFFVGLGQTAGSGVKDRYNDPIRGAGDVIAWVLYDHNEYPVDRGRVEAVRDRLNVYKIDTFLTEPTNLWDWLNDEVLPVLPIEWRESAEGIYPAIWHWSATARDVVQHLDASRPGGTVHRVSPVTIESGEIYNEISIEYGPRAGGGGSGWRFRRIATSTARAVARNGSPGTDLRVRGSALLAESQRVYGVRQLTIQLAAVWDHDTADLVLRDAVTRYAWPRRRVSYSGPRSLENRAAGDVVAITDPDLHLDEVLALVLAVTPAGESATIDLLLLDHPAVLRRSTT